MCFLGWFSFVIKIGVFIWIKEVLKLSMILLVMKIIRVLVKNCMRMLEMMMIDFMVVGMW